MELPLLHPSSPKISTSFIPHGLLNLPAARNTKDGIAFITLRESKHSLRTLFRAADPADDDDEHRPKTSVTFYINDDNEKPPIAFADDLFRNGIIVPLCPPSLKLPPRLQAISGGAVSPRSPLTASSPKSPHKVRGLKGWKDFDPFVAAVERIRKEDASLKPFHWRQLETSFKESYGRVFDDAWGETGWDLVGGDEDEVSAGRRSMNGRSCCKKRKQNCKLLSCLLRTKGWDEEKHSR